MIDCRAKPKHVHQTRWDERINPCLECKLPACDDRDPGCKATYPNEKPVEKYRMSYAEIARRYEIGESLREIARVSNIPVRELRTMLPARRGRPKVFMPKGQVKADRSGGRPRKRDERFVSFLVSIVVEKRLAG